MRRPTLLAGLIIGAAVLFTAACATLQRDLFVFTNPAGAQWVTCEIPDTAASQVYRVRGGQAARLTLPRGHTLDIPARALPTGQEVDITFRQYAGPFVAVWLGPDTLRFRTPATLTLAYGGRSCDVPAGAALTVYRARSTGAHEPLPRGDGPEVPQAAHAAVDHFSAFALAR